MTMRLPRTAHDNHKSRPVMVFADTSQVRYGGHVVAVGTAARAIMRERGWMGVRLVDGPGVVRFEHIDGEGSVVLTLAPVKEG